MKALTIPGAGKSVGHGKESLEVQMHLELITECIPESGGVHFIFKSVAPS